MALAQRARKNPRRSGMRKSMKGMGSCAGRGMHGKGKKSKLMKGLGFLKSASKALKKSLKKKNVKKLLDTVEVVADVAGDFAATEEGKARAARVGNAAGKARKTAKKLGVTD